MTLYHSRFGVGRHETAKPKFDNHLRRPTTVGRLSSHMEESTQERILFDGRHFSSYSFGRPLEEGQFMTAVAARNTVA
jgi:hypothetical protein